MALADRPIDERFSIRQEHFAHGDVTLCLALPRTADELIDEQAFARDERLPYWANLWSAAPALATWLVDHPFPPAARIIELGCGLALPSLVLKSLGANVLATDYEPEALAFAQLNVERNNLNPLPTKLLDWREPAPDLGTFDIAIGADLLYEERNAIALADLMPRLLKPGGRFILADPGRRYEPLFEQLMQQAGWKMIERTAPPMRILEWRQPGDSDRHSNLA